MVGITSVDIHQTCCESSSISRVCSQRGALDAEHSRIVIVSRHDASRVVTVSWRKAGSNKPSPEVQLVSEMWMSLLRRCRFTQTAKSESCCVSCSSRIVLWTSLWWCGGRSIPSKVTSSIECLRECSSLRIVDLLVVRHLHRVKLPPARRERGDRVLLDDEGMRREPDRTNIRRHEPSCVRVNERVTCARYFD